MSHIHHFSLPARLFLLFALCTCFPYSTAIAGNFKVDLENNHLSLTATDIPLQSILLELAAQGITVKIDPQINPTINAHFSKLPIEQGLDSIVKPASYSLVWKKNPHLTPQDSFDIAEIQVFQSGRKDKARPLGGGAHGQLAQNTAGIFYVKNEILLHLPPKADPRELAGLLKSYGATLLPNKKLPGIVRILLPDTLDVFATAEEIKQKLNLDLVEPNYAYRSQSPVQYTAAPVQAQTEQLTEPEPEDDSPSIAILDSGFSDTAGLDPVVLFTLDALNPHAEISDTLGHGTQMALIASGLISPYSSTKESTHLVPIIPIKVFDDHGFATSISIIESINFALSNDAKVMSLSWGTAVKSDFLENAFANASSRGLVIVASAGNEPTGSPVYPAAYSSVIGVGALTPNGAQWSSSNYGDFVTLYAPGFANIPVGHNGAPGLYAGTSISAALVANSAAGYLAEHPQASRQEILSYLESKY